MTFLRIHNSTFSLISLSGLFVTGVMSSIETRSADNQTGHEENQEYYT